METELGVALKTKLIKNMSDRFNLIEDNDVSPCFAISTVLDPRFKKVAFTNIELANKAIQSINNELAVSIGNDYLRTHWLVATAYYLLFSYIC
jgi:hypothetical protein